jgi:Chalcone isomerase-like
VPGITASAPAVTLAAEVAAELPLAKLMGSGRLRVWGFDVYDARFWAAPGLNARDLARQPFALELVYLRDFKASAIAASSVDEIRRQATVSEQQEAAWTAELLRAMPDIRKGDRVIGIHRPGAPATLWVNGQRSGELRDPGFIALFFGIWLSPATSQPQLRAALLAGAVR